MPGPAPKPAALRQRRNKTSTRANLPSPEKAARRKVPPLFEREGGWHVKVLEWWQSVWRSPMRSEYLDSDMRGGLFRLALLYQDMWTAADAKERLEVAKEIRLQEVGFGLSPINRRQLQWEIEKGESAAEKTKSRKQRKPAPVPTDDPRGVLKIA